MKHPSSVGDTQRGEAYIILVYAMDTLLAMFILAGRKIWTISFSAALRVLLLCTWWCHMTSLASGQYIFGSAWQNIWRASRLTQTAKRLSSWFPNFIHLPTLPIIRWHTPSTLCQMLATLTTKPPNEDGQVLTLLLLRQTKWDPPLIMRQLMIISETGIIKSRVW